MTALPRAADVLLVVESAASSLKSDRHVKLPIYAAAGIAEYWIVDLNDKSLVRLLHF
jgi:Uma2 family endonuclease